MEDTSHETAAEADLSGVKVGRNITLDELTVELAGIELRLRQLARAAETPDTPVELADAISTMRSNASTLRKLSGQTAFLARIVGGDVPLVTQFPNGAPWGAAARGTDRADYGGPAIVPTMWQLLRLAQDADKPAGFGETTTYPEAMAGVGLGWESKEAQGRRRRERDAAVIREVLLIQCTSCHSNEGEQCRTKNGWAAESPHVPRQREAEARVDARLGHLGENPVHVPDA